MSAPGCDHKFVDSNHCLKCGWSPSGKGGDVVDLPSTPSVVALAKELHSAAYELSVGPYKLVVLLPTNVPDAHVGEVYGTGANFLRVLAEGMDKGLAAMPPAVPMSKGGVA